MARTSEGRVQGRAWCPPRDRITDALCLKQKPQKDTRGQRPSTRVSDVRCRHHERWFTLCGIPYCPICRRKDRNQIAAIFATQRGEA